MKTCCEVYKLWKLFFFFFAVSVYHKQMVYPAVAASGLLHYFYLSSLEPVWPAHSTLRHSLLCFAAPPPVCDRLLWQPAHVRRVHSLLLWKRVNCAQGIGLKRRRRVECTGHKGHQGYAHRERKCVQDWFPFVGRAELMVSRIPEECFTILSNVNSYNCSLNCVSLEFWSFWLWNCYVFPNSCFHKLRNSRWRLFV